MIRPRYACRRCDGGVLQAAAPARLIEGGLPTEGTLAARSLANVSANTAIGNARLAAELISTFSGRAL